MLRVRLAFLTLLLTDFAPIFLIALKWYWVTNALLGSLSNLVSLRALLNVCILLTADIPLRFAKYSVSGLLYADDVQANVHGPPS